MTRNVLPSTGHIVILIVSDQKPHVKVTMNPVRKELKKGAKSAAATEKKVLLQESRAPQSSTSREVTLCTDTVEKMHVCIIECWPCTRTWAGLRSLQ